MFRAYQATLAAFILGSVMLGPAHAPARAQFSDELEVQAQCELSAIGSTRSRLALDWIHTACNRLAVDTGALHESNRRFHTCLIANLSGVQNDYAASRIINSCRTAYPP